MEKSYRKISFTEAARILYLNKPDELIELAKKVKQRSPFSINCDVFIAWLAVASRSNIPFR
jgi:hypothetical protein